MTKKVRTAIIALSVLLAVSVLCLAGTLIYRAIAGNGSATAVVPGNLISPEASGGDESGSASVSGSALGEGASDPESQASGGSLNQSGSAAEALYLHSRNEGDNTPFRAVNMFPGDTEVKYFCVRVSHKGNVTVRYHADIRNGYEKLAEVLRCRVVLLSTGEVLYDGLMRDMPESINHPLDTDTPVISELYYEIDAYLDTSVGNEYQNKDLVADFRWWVEEVDNLDIPQTGDGGVAIYVGLAAASLLLIVFLWKRGRKEEADCGE